MTASHNYFDITLPRWNSYNTILEKKAYFDSDTNKIFISNFDGSEVVPLNIKIDPEDKNIILQWMPNSNLVLCNYRGKFYKFNLRGEVVGISKIRDDLADVWEDNEKLNSIHFSPNGQKFLYYNQKGIVICDQDLHVLQVYENKSEYPAQLRLFPAFSYLKDKVYYMLHKIKDVNAPFQVVLSSMELNSNKEIQITPDSMNVVEFALSYDDKYAAVLTSENYKKLYIYDIRERAVKYIIMENFNIYYFRFHPTENKLILNVNTDISVMNIDGTEKKVITKNGILQGISKFSRN
jgi:Tol biopolymer transport system component